MKGGYNTTNSKLGLNPTVIYVGYEDAISYNFLHIWTVDSRHAALNVFCACSTSIDDFSSSPLLNLIRPMVFEVIGGYKKERIVFMEMTLGGVNMENVIRTQEQRMLKQLPP
jgi:hypothetical protein